MSRLSRIALLLAVIALVIAVQWRALFSFFSADDLVHLQQAGGLLPTPHVPWRFLTQVVHFRLMYAVVGPWPGAFMLVNLALHSANVALLIGLLVERRVPRPTAALAAVLFGACPFLTVVIGHAVIINDISALTFSLLALRWLSRDTRVARVMGTLAFLVALFCKESVLFLPLLAAVPVAVGSSTRARLRAIAPVLVVIVCASVAFFIARSYAAAPSGGAYVLSAWPAPFHNLMTYTSWVVSLHQPLPDLVRSLSPTAWRIGLPVLLLIGGVATGVPAVRSTILFGLTWWVLGLLPVLPLTNSAYPHYMYVALPGIALALAATMQGILSLGRRRIESRDPIAAAAHRASRLWPVLATVLALAYTARSATLASERYTLRLAGSDLPLDPQIRSSIVAGRAVYSVAAVPLEPHTRLAILNRLGQRQAWGARTGTRVCSSQGHGGGLRPPARGSERRSGIAGVLSASRFGGLRATVEPHARRVLDCRTGPLRRASRLRLRPLRAHETDRPHQGIG